MLNPVPRAVSERKTRKARVLFVAEAITLAQVVRLLALSSRLDRGRYEVFFASALFEPVAFADTSLVPIPLFTVDRGEALKKIERGERLYEQRVLARYVEEELALFDSVRPDVVIGDFRLSLAVSARRAGIPYAALINAYFSPYARRDGFPVPDHPLVALLGAKRAAEYFPRALPLVFAHFVAPLDALRKQHGLPPSGGLLNALSDADFTLYPDVPDLCPTHDAPSSHRYVGPIPWAPRIPLPSFFERLEPERPLVYVTLGSSGRISARNSVFSVLGKLPVNVVVSTAGRFDLRDAPPNVHVADFVPGDLVARRAAFVVTNGGASTSYQALAEGKPVLGVPSNLDQYLAMTAIERAGAGRLVRSGEATPRAIEAAASELLESAALRRGAEAVGKAFARSDCHTNFRNLLDEILTCKSEQTA